MFATTIDPKEMDLIDRVGKRINPGAWDDRPVLRALNGQCVEDEDSTKTMRALNEKNRARAREVAIDIIAVVREHDAGKVA